MKVMEDVKVREDVRISSREPSVSRHMVREKDLERNEGLDLYLKADAFSGVIMQ